MMMGRSSHSVPGTELVFIAILMAGSGRVIIGCSSRQVGMIVVVTNMLRSITRHNHITRLNLITRRELGCDKVDVSLLRWRITKAGSIVSLKTVQRVRARVDRCPVGPHIRSGWVTLHEVVIVNPSIVWKLGDHVAMEPVAEAGVWLWLVPASLACESGG